MSDAVQQVDREAVRTLCVAIGVREAARKLGLSEDRVRQWSSRGKWLQTEHKPQPPTVTQHHVTTVTKPADALANQLADDSQETRFSLSKAAKNAAKSFAEKTGEAVIKQSRQLKDITSAASTLHGWEEKREGGLTLNVGLVLGGME